MAKSTKGKPKGKPICGIIMPISEIDGCPESHWADILEIISESVEDAGFESNLVSNADEVGVIQKRIINNVYENPIVICDVSGKNPNVMFELGLRLAFDKPTIIIKDDKTAYSFDTAPIEHLEYPRDLRFNKMVEFKEKLSDKICKTYEASLTDPSFSTFLKHFGEFKVAKIDHKEVTEQEFILEELKNIKVQISELSNRQILSKSSIQNPEKIDICFRDLNETDVAKFMEIIENHDKVKETNLRKITPKHTHATIIPKDTKDLLPLRSEISKIIGTRYPVRLK